MQYINRYHIVPNKEAEYRQWLLDNEQALANNASPGWTYLGTWFTVVGFGHYGCETRWELDDYASLGAGFGNETFQKLLKEWSDRFIDQTRDGETYLMKSTSNVQIME